MSKSEYVVVHKDSFTIIRGKSRSKHKIRGVNWVGWMDDKVVVATQQGTLESVECTLMQLPSPIKSVVFAHERVWVSTRQELRVYKGMKEEICKKGLMQTRRKSQARQNMNRALQ